MEKRHKGKFHSVEIIAYWLGATAMVVAPLFKNLTTWILCLIFGLCILTIQSFTLEIWNLVALNLISILVYSRRYLIEKNKERIQL